MTTPAMRSSRFHALDVWRGVVCLMVVVEHAGVALWHTAPGKGLDGWIRRVVIDFVWMFLGAPLFFVMSGYCIASCIDSARRRGTTATRFLARRVWRIFPPYWAALAGFVALVAGLDAVGLGRYHGDAAALGLCSPGVLDTSQWLGNLTLTETWRPLLMSNSESIVYTRMAWSLCYQEQFYVVCFLTLLAARVRFWPALAGVTAVTLFLRVFTWDSGMMGRIAGTFPERWHEFAIGLAVYWRLSRPATPGIRRGLELGLVLLLVVGLGNGLVSTVGAAGFGLLLIVCHRWDRLIPDLRWLDPLRACGRMSYSVYLVHLPVVMIVNNRLHELGLSGFWPRVLVMIPAGILASVAVGWTFHRVVEHHFLDLPTLRPVADVLQASRRAWKTAATALIVKPTVRRMPALGVSALIAVSLAAGSSWIATDGLRTDLRSPATRFADAMTRPQANLHRHDEHDGPSRGMGPKLVGPRATVAFNWVDRAYHDSEPAAWERLSPRDQRAGRRHAGASPRHRDPLFRDRTSPSGRSS